MWFLITWRWLDEETDRAQSMCIAFHLERCGCGIARNQQQRKLMAVHMTAVVGGGGVAASPPILFFRLMNHQALYLLARFVMHGVSRDRFTLLTHLRSSFVNLKKEESWCQWRFLFNWIMPENLLLWIRQCWSASNLAVYFPFWTKFYVITPHSIHGNERIFNCNAHHIFISISFINESLCVDSTSATVNQFFFGSLFSLIFVCLIFGFDSFLFSPCPCVNRSHYASW